MGSENHQSTGDGKEPMTTQEEVAKQIDDWATRKTAAPKKGTVTPRVMKKHSEEVQVMMQTKNWTGVKPGHVLALYKWCHDKVYGVPASELDNGYEYLQACALISRFVKKEFDENLTACVAFVRWTWQREAWKEKKRREEGDESRGFRVGWKYQFSPRLVTDYRLDQARRKGL